MPVTRRMSNCREGSPWTEAAWEFRVEEEVRRPRCQYGL